MRRRRRRRWQGTHCLEGLAAGALAAASAALAAAFLYCGLYVLFAAGAAFAQRQDTHPRYVI